MCLRQFPGGIKFCFSALCVYLITLASPGMAQESRASIVGRVTDSSGAVTPGVTITATNQSTNVSAHAVSNADGAYQILSLNPGPYRVFAELAGFKTYQRENIELRINDRVGVDILLEPGNVSEKIVVSGETPLLETASINVGQVISNRNIAELPIPHGSVRALFFLAGGVALAGGGNSIAMKFQDPSRPASSSWLSFNGSPLGSTEFTLDGVPNTQTSNSDFGEGMSNQPPADAIQEVKLETAYDASVGHTSGSHITMVLKSGTNDLHGTAYFFYRNPSLNANSFLSNMAGRPRLDFAYERGGFNINAPVRIPKIYNGKNRTFFSYTYEIMNDYSQGYPLLATVPTLEERAGDFSALLKLGSKYQIYDPATTSAVSGGRFSRLPFAGNIIPSSRIDPIAQKIQQFWPKPNVAGLPDGTNNFSVTSSDPNLYQNHIVRVDHVIGDKQRLYGHVAKYFKTEGPFRDYFLNQASGQFARIQPLNVATDYTYIFSANFVMDLRYGFQRYPIAGTPKSVGFDLSTLGFPQAVVNQLAYRNPLSVTFPTVGVSGVQTLNGENPSYTGDDIHSWFADFNHPVGNHALKFGGEGRVYRKNAYSYTDGTPRFFFGTAFTNGPLDNSASSPGGVGQGMAGFLLGQPTNADVNINDSYAIKSTEYGAYLQDDWRITPKLTVTMGLRYEYAGPLSERFNRTTRGFDPTASLPIAAQVQSNYAANPIPEIPPSQFQVRGGVVFAGVGGQPHTLYPADTRNFMPRFGFAYHPLKNTVIRAGYGIYYLDNGVVSRFGPYQLGYSQTTNLIPTINNGVTLIANLENPFPNGIATPTGNRNGPMTNAGQGVAFFDTGLNTPYMQRWNWTMQQLLPGSFSLQLGYAGSRSTGLLVGKNYNGLPDQYLSTLPVRDQSVINRLSQQVTNPFYPLLPGTALAGRTVSVSQLLLPFPQFTNMSSTTNQGYSWYHSLQAMVERRFANGFSFQLSYTFSKQMDAIYYLNAGDAMPYRSISAGDRPHHVGIAAIYELPFGKGKALLSNAPTPVRQIVGGWQLGAVVNSWSGTPLSFGDMIFNGDIKNIPLPSGQRTVQRWFNTQAGFVTAPAQQLASHLFTGPLYYSGIRSDGLNTTDLSVLRYIGLRETMKLQIRAEALNAFNHPNFAPPNTSVTSSAFGTVNTESTFTRIIQFGVKLIF
ncbi:MAG TPA: hypothetical protein DEQ47_16765 [Solibacterales bacterium]|nr:hypothetical protein [Bryobacterales bacterium]